MLKQRTASYTLIFSIVYTTVNKRWRQTGSGRKEIHTKSGVKNLDRIPRFPQQANAS